MFNWGARYLLTLSGLSYVAACAYGVATGGGIVGVLSLGYKQGVGDHLGYSLGMGLAFALTGFAVVALLSREGELVDDNAQYQPVAAIAQSSPSYVAPVAALAVALFVAGVAISTAFLVAGLVLGFMIGLQWAMQAWSDGLTDDPSVNSVARAKVASIFDVPVFGLLVIGFIVVGISRILLAVPAEASTAIASIAAALVFVTAIFIAKKEPSRRVVNSLIAFGAVAVLIGGIVAAGVGEREHEKHGSDSEHSEGEA